jgi:hypothetical protein
VEAAGIEPASRGTSVPASTCVARLLSDGRDLAAPPPTFAPRAPDRQGPRKATRL